MRETAKVSAIIWDFGNVLARFDHYRACTKLATHSSMAAANIYTALFESSSSPCYPFSIGEMGNNEFFNAVRRTISLQAAVTYREFCAIWADIFTDDGRMSVILKLVRPDVRQCVLSNTQPIHWQRIVTLPVIAECFADTKQHILSFNVGALKPDTTMYQAALGAMDISMRDIDSVLLIDDVKEYCDRFRSLGGNAHRFSIVTDSTQTLEEALRGMELVP